MYFKNIEILHRKIGPGHPPFIIAEMSGKHNAFVKVRFSECKSNAFRFYGEKKIEFWIYKT